MIIVQVTDGLGNQLFQYAIGRRLSLLFNTRLFIDNSHFINFNHRRFALEFFNTQFSPINNYKLFALKHPISFLRLKLGFYSHFQEKEGVPLEVKSFSNNSFLSGRWLNEAYFKSIRTVLLKDLKIKVGTRSNLFDYYKNLIFNSNSVSLHIRRGDFLEEKNKNIFELLDMRYYSEAMQLVSKSIANPTFFIFSDDMEWSKNNFIGFSNIIYIENYNKLADFEELVLMSYCKHNIIANSSFSWWGAWINENNDKIVIQPEHSYRNTNLQNAYELNNLLYSENFIRL